MTSGQIIEVIQNLIEIDKDGPNRDQKYPVYVKRFVEEGDKSAIDTLNYSIMIIESNLDRLKEYASFTNYRLSEGKYIYGASNVKDAFIEIRSFCEARMCTCPTKFHSKWEDLKNRIQKIIIFLGNELSQRKKITVTIGDKSYEADFIIDGTSIGDNDDFMELLQTVCNVYTSGHGVKVKMNWEEKNADNGKSV